MVETKSGLQVPEPIPEDIKKYSGWGYTAKLANMLLDEPILARMGNIGDNSISDFYWTDARYIAYDMADDWPGSFGSQEGFFAVNYKFDSKSRLYDYDFQVIASGSKEEFDRLREIAIQALKGEKNLKAEVGFNTLRRVILLPGKDSHIIRLESDMETNYNFIMKNVCYDRLVDIGSKVAPWFPGFE